MINAHFNAHKNQDNAQWKAHYPIFKVCNIFLVILFNMFITPKHLNSLAGGSLLGDFANNPVEGYRTLIPSKTTQTPPFPSHLTRQGGARKVCL
jgi:hypothetical protein